MRALFTLKIKASYFTSKMGLLGNNRELQFRVCKVWPNHRQVQQRRGPLFYGGGSWEGLFWTKVLWRRARVQGDDGSHWLSCRGGRSLVGENIHIFPVGACNWWFESFLLWILLVGSVMDTSCNWLGGVQLPLLASPSSLLSLPTLLVRFPFIHVQGFYSL